MKTVLLVQPSGGYWDRLQGTGLPLSTLQASVLVAREYDVVLFDARLHADWRERLAAILTDRQPFLVGVTVMLGPQLDEAMVVNRLAKSLVPGVRTVWGGTFPTLAPEIAITAPGLDYLIQRDGEEALAGLARWLDGGGGGPESGAGPDVPNLFWRGPDGALAGRMAAQPVDLESLPELPYRLLEAGAYSRGFKGGDTVALETSRGCVLDCSYCYNHTMSGRRWRGKSAARVRRDLQHLLTWFPAARVFVMDDNFFVDPGRAAEVAGELGRSGRQWATHGLTPVDATRFDAPYVDHLAATGCYELRLGLDNAADGNMRRMNKFFDKPRLLEVNRLLARQPIKLQFAMVFGFPGETGDDLRENLRYLFELLDDNPRAGLFMISVLFPFPGTHVYERHAGEAWKASWGLAEYARFQVNHAGRPWLDDRQWRLLSAITLASLFVSRKEFSFSPGFGRALELVRRVYAPVARHRLRNFAFGFAPELTIFNELLEHLGRDLWRVLRMKVRSPEPPGMASATRPR